MISTLIISLALWWELVTIVCLLAVTWLDVRQERRLLALYPPAELPRAVVHRDIKPVKTARVPIGMVAFVLFASYTTARAAGKDRER